MTDSFLKYLLATLILVVAVEGLANAQNSDPITAVRIDGRPDTAALDPLIDESTFTSAGISDSRFNAGGSLPGNINGPSVIRVRDWIPASERVNPDANYYMYFAHHVGRDIRLAWSDSLTGDWNVPETFSAFVTPCLLSCVVCKSEQSWPGATLVRGRHS